MLQSFLNFRVSRLIVIAAYFSLKIRRLISTEPLNVAATSHLSIINDRVPVPAKFIESMYILNELVLLFVEYFKIVFQAFPSLFVGLANKLDKALLVAPQVYGNPRSYLLLFELMVQLGAHDASPMRILPYMIQEINNVVDCPGIFSAGSSALVTKVYDSKLTCKSSLHEQIHKFEILVRQGI